jgi:CheY-like chemotaxis protein
VSGSGVKVLVVDDTPAHRYVRAKVVSRAGYEVIEAATGREALELAESADVLLLDVFLPDIDGLEICRILRARPTTRSLPIIHISSVFVSDTDAHDGAASGADAYLIDPVPPGVLVQVIDSTLAQRRAAGPGSAP